LFLVIYVTIRETGTGKVPGETPGKILDERFARGELTTE